MIEAVIFDLFETLITERGRSGPKRPSVASRLGVDKQAFCTEWYKRQEARMTGRFPDYSSALIDTCAALRCAIDSSLIHQLEAERAAHFAAVLADVEDCVIRALEEIRWLSVKIGLVSNASADEVSTWNDCRISGLIDVGVFSCETGYMKPDPRIYLIAGERLGVDPQRCMYVGDGASGELSGAARVGMIPYRATWFLDRWPKDAPGVQEPVPDSRYPTLPTIDDLLIEVRRAVCGQPTGETQ